VITESGASDYNRFLHNIGFDVITTVGAHTINRQKPELVGRRLSDRRPDLQAAWTSADQPANVNLGKMWSQDT
jgi:hypothetical protein